MSNQFAFFMDTSRCIKCWACVVACKQWNGIDAGGISRRKVEEENVGVYPDVNRVFFSHACNHCENPACVEICPTGALTKREEDGLVVFDIDTCIGCASCGTACPYGVPEYSDRMTGNVHLEKCDGCAVCGQTPDDPSVPRCVATCPTKALRYGPIEEMEALAAEKGGARMEGETLPCTFVYDFTA